ncbi:MAG: YhbY family RNA-binding protein [Pelagibacteraceae bacterium TMED124]|nr:ribosome assembly RNA-binding protein YhbY [Candidatus Neomarinimicrobiota bacterium]RPG18598.1 MAG: YhbY family RNA-binding protein [Pelagibacteraceae bacterium TMED124]|tara:strand:- start:1684 stop:1980 length:297 start_codon:yes stop_codon:yes gene_type:complete
MQLNSKQRKILRSKAHNLKPSIIIGKSGLDEPVFKSIDECVDSNELIKIKFNDYKDDKSTFLCRINDRLKTHTVGVVGNIAILYRQNPDLDKRIYKIE